MLDPHYTTGRIADLLGLSVRKVAQLTTSGAIACWTVPPHHHLRRIPPRALAAFLATQHDYRKFLRNGEVRPSKFTASEVAALVALADEIAEATARIELATAG